MTQPNEQLIETIERSVWQHENGSMDLLVFQTQDEICSWLRALLEENKRLRGVDERESLFTINLNKELQQTREERNDFAKSTFRLNEENVILAQFAKTVLSVGFQGDMDGGQIQELGINLGLLDKTSYDPELHGESYAEVGDDWYVLSSILSQYKGELIDEK